MKEWQKVFQEFHDANEAGGSSRWLVSPATVEAFIAVLLTRQKRQVAADIQQLIEETVELSSIRNPRQVWKTIRTALQEKYGNV